MHTALLEDVQKKMKDILLEYNQKDTKTLKDILCFHVKFERIHPFQDGNGRVERLIMFKECLQYKTYRTIHYRSLKEWDREEGYLTDTSLKAQNRYKVYLDYFRMKYKRDN